MNIDKYVLVKPIGKGEISEIFLVVDIIESFTNLYAAQTGWLTCEQRNKIAARSTNIIRGNEDSKLLNQLEAQVQSAYKDENKKFLLREYALKVLNTPHAKDPELINRFSEEYNFAKKSDHPNILRVYEYGVIQSENPRPYFTMEYFEELYSYEQIMGFPLYWKIEFVKQALHGLDEMHQKGIAHRNLRPASIISAKAGEGIIAKVVDFGLVKEYLNSQFLKKSGMIMGTPDYLAPDQAKDTEKTGIQCDMFSMGVILYQLLTGKIPYSIQGRGMRQILDYYRQVEAGFVKPDPVRALNPNVPPDLERTTMRAIDHDPSKRIFMGQMGAEFFAKELEGIQGKLV